MTWWALSCLCLRCRPFWLHILWSPTARCSGAHMLTRQLTHGLSPTYVFPHLCLCTCCSPVKFNGGLAAGRGHKSAALQVCRIRHITCACAVVVLYFGAPAALLGCRATCAQALCMRIVRVHASAGCHQYQRSRQGVRQARLWVEVLLGS